MTRRVTPRSTTQLTFGGACAVVDTALFKQAIRDDANSCPQL
jgi:hypothetical protein